MIFSLDLPWANMIESRVRRKEKRKGRENEQKGREKYIPPNLQLD